VVDESLLNLTAVGGPGILIPPGIAAPPIVMGSHDNVDGFNCQPFDLNADGLTDKGLYFSVNPDEAAVLGLSAADIFLVNPAGVGGVFAPAPQLGLDMMGLNIDDVDALVIYDFGIQGQLDPGVDSALFSLSFGSASLPGVPGGPQIGPGDIFYTDFNGSFALFASATEVGLFPSPFYPQQPGDNIDSLEVVCPGDANLDGWVNVGDLGILGANYNTPGAGWLTADFNGNGIVNVGDLGILGANYGGGTGGLPTSTPEPATMGLLVLGGLAVLRRRRS
jgi:hypothetical protein